MVQHPDRLVPLQGASNFRDLGGYPGQGGRPVRWRRLYRSDHLGQLTAADHDELRRRGVSAALDFRGVEESAAAAYQVPGLQRHALSIEPTVARRMEQVVAAGLPLDEAATEGLMRELYRDIVRRQAPRLAQFFGHVADHPSALVFHCTAGKDRTGVAAALLLLTLGVRREVVMEDFLLTNQVFRPPAQANPDLDPGVRRALWSVRPHYLEAALAVVDEEYGGVNGYLHRALGLDAAAQERLVAGCLEPATQR